MSNVEEFFAHHGVKGMKWGIRNKRTTGERRARAKRDKISKRRRTLSDGDIKKYIARLQEERRLKELVNEDLRPGQTAAKKIISDSGQKVARTVVTGAMLYGMKLAVDKKFGQPGAKIKIDPQDVAGYMLPKPKK